MQPSASDTGILQSALDISAALTKDSYNTPKKSRFYVEEDRFFDQLYVPPNELLLKLQANISGGDNAIRILHLDGYAGCGKTLAVHKLIRDNGYQDGFYYSFGIGGGDDIGPESVVSIMISRLSIALAQAITDDRTFRLSPKLSQLCTSCLDNTFLDLFVSIEEHACSLDDASIETELRNQLRAAINELESMDNSTSQQIQCLLILDFCLRVKLASQSDTSYVFCLLDNIDGLTTQASVSLFEDVSAVLVKLRNHLNTSEDEDLGGRSFIYILPTRAVTHRKIIDELRRRKKTQIIGDRNFYVSASMAETSVSHHSIVDARAKYWIPKLDEAVTPHFDKIVRIFELPVIEKSFAPLFNCNYTMTASHIIRLCEDFPEQTDEILRIAGRISDSEGAERLALEDGLRGYLLRLLMRFLENEGMFASPLDETGKYNGSGKLGLTRLYTNSSAFSPDSDLRFAPRASSGNYRVTISRVLLTFLRESPGKEASMDDLFDCFDGMFTTEQITATIYALCIHGRDMWRRIVMLHQGETLEYKDFHDICLDPLASSSPTVEICPSGITLIDDVAPKFEFYLSRNGKASDLDTYPPLFSGKSTERAEMLCAHQRPLNVGGIRSIDFVTRTIESYASSLCKFDQDLVRRCVSEHGGHEATPQFLDRLFARSASSSDETQLHLARVVFSHVSYIEHYRRMYLSSQTKSNAIPPERIGLINFNRVIISYIARYLALFDFTRFAPGADAERLLDDQSLPANYKSAKDRPSCTSTMANIRSTIKTGGVDRNASKVTANITRLEKGFDAQSNAHRKLIDQALAIHQDDYRTIGDISAG